MDIIKKDDIGYDPFIRTEETIFDNLKNYYNEFNNFKLIVFPLANFINKRGLKEAQKVINEIDRSDNKYNIFICQHILISDLSFYKNDLVFTPHSNIFDNLYSIPHYAVNIDKERKKDLKDRKNLFSFLGSLKTHWTRKKLNELYPNRCFDSGVLWGLDNNIDNKKEFNNKYINLLADSKFSLCPRGTGISSVRIFESMAMGSIPVIISDNYEPPLSNFLDWNEFSVLIKENEVYNIKEKILSISEEEIKNMREKMDTIYNNNFKNNILHKSVYKNIYSISDKRWKTKI